MKRVVTADEMRKLDKTASEEFKIPPEVLMENAGSQAAGIIRTLVDDYPSIVILVGPGHNGGDAATIARHLQDLKTQVFVAPNLCEKTKIQVETLRRCKLRVYELTDSELLAEFFQKSSGPHLVIDGLMGVGLSRPITGVFADVIDLINAEADYIVSLDVPSGVCATSGEIRGPAVRADQTITFGFMKQGLLLAPGAEYAGDVIVADITLPKIFSEQGDKYLLQEEHVQGLLGKRSRYGHKNSFGQCLVVGGSVGKTGAAVLAGNGCLQVGAGLVTVATWKDAFGEMVSRLPAELMSLGIETDSDKYEMYREKIKSYSSIVVGPGLSTRAESYRVVCDLIMEYQGALVIDADGINVINDKILGFLRERKYPTVLTPHPGEMARILKKDKAEIMADPVGALRACVEITGSVCLLKGATTLISDGGPVWFHHFPNDAMATAGTGDVLAGVIGAFLGQGMKPIDAVRLGVYVHGLAGRLAGRHITASQLDLAGALSQVRAC